MEIHEFPSVTYKSKVKIQNSMAVTIEPGIYIPGKGGIRIEDDVLPNKENPEVLTKAKRSFTNVSCQFSSEETFGKEAKDKARYSVN